MKIKMKGHRKQTETAMKLWFKWVEDYNVNGLTVKEISEKYINPKTNKPYTRANIYFAFHRLEKLTA